MRSRRTQAGAASPSRRAAWDGWRSCPSSWRGYSGRRGPGREGRRWSLRRRITAWWRRASQATRRRSPRRWCSTSCPAARRSASWPRTRAWSLVIVDAGVAAPLPDHPGLRSVSAGRGTADISRGPAMSPRAGRGVRGRGRSAGDGGGGARRGHHRHGRHGNRQHDGVERDYRGDNRKAAGRDDGAGHGAQRPGDAAQDRRRGARAGGEPARLRGRTGRAGEGGRLRDRRAGRRGARGGARAQGSRARWIHIRRSGSHRAQPFASRAGLHGGGPRVSGDGPSDRPVAPGAGARCWTSR